MNESRTERASAASQCHAVVPSALDLRGDGIDIALIGEFRRAPLDDRPPSISMGGGALLSLRVQVGIAGRLRIRHAMDTWRSRARLAAGCAAAHAVEDVACPGAYVLATVWWSGDDLHAHLVGADFQRLLDTIDDLAHDAEVTVSAGPQGATGDCREGLCELRGKLRLLREFLAKSEVSDASGTPAKGPQGPSGKAVA